MNTKIRGTWMKYVYVSLLIVCLGSVYLSAGKSVTKDVFHAFDDLMQSCYDAVTDNCITRTMVNYSNSYAPVLDVAAVAGGIVLACKYHKNITFRSVGMTAGGIYFANRLLPDWLKDFCSHVPLLHFLVSENRMREKSSWGPAYTAAELCLIVGIGYGLRHDFKPVCLAPCVALACLVSLLTKGRVRNTMQTIPVLRRLV